MVEFLRATYNFIVFFNAKLRAGMYRLVCGHIGENVDILRGVRILCPAKVRIGNNCSINIYVSLDGNGGLTIGNYVMIGPYSQLISANHGYNSRLIPMLKQDIVTDSITIEDDVWLGSNVIILPGVTIGRGAIVGAGAVVTRNVEPFHIVAGVPAKTIAVRPD